MSSTAHNINNPSDTPNKQGSVSSAQQELGDLKKLEKFSILDTAWYKNNLASGDQLNHLGSWFHPWKFDWVRPPIPSNDSIRCQVVKSYNLINTANEVVLDNLCELAAAHFTTSYVGITIVDTDYAHVKAYRSNNPLFNGWKGAYRHASLCSWTVHKGQPLIIPDLSQDPATAKHPATASGMKFYAAVPLTATQGHHIGTFCLLDTKANHNFTKAQQESLATFTSTIMSFIESKQFDSTLDKMKSKFVANIGHEMRTPLQGIVGLCELLQNTQLSPLQNEYVTDCAHQADISLALVNDVLDFRSLQNGLLQIEHRPFSPRTLLIDCCKEVNSFTCRYEKSSAIQLFQPFDQEFQCYGDKNKIKQILTILLNNAAKFSSASSDIKLTVQFEAKEPSVPHTSLLINQHSTIPANRINSMPPDFNSFYLHCSVIDNGIGINQDMLTRVFQPFVQADDENSRLFGGKGLGLPITKHLVELLQGKIWVESQQKKGSAFHFYVKLYNKPEFATDDSKTAFLTTQTDYFTPSSAPNAILTASPTISLSQSSSTMSPPPQERMYSASDNSTIAEQLNRLNLDRKTKDSSQTNKPVFISYNSAETHSHSTSHSELSSPVIGSSLRVLAVDDNHINLKVIGRILELEGFHCVLADNGRAAIETASNGEFDFILMDLQLPEMDGFEITRHLRLLESQGKLYTNAAALPRFQRINNRIPIVALTASYLPSDRDKCYQSGMDAILNKPLNKKQLKSIIHQLLQPCSSPTSQ
jgi:signal transduction histidine kinase/CheY-like chemotaxis protein